MLEQAVMSKGGWKCCMRVGGVAIINMVVREGLLRRDIQTKTERNRK